MVLKPLLEFSIEISEVKVSRWGLEVMPAASPKGITGRLTLIWKICVSDLYHTEFDSYLETLGGSTEEWEALSPCRCLGRSPRHVYQRKSCG